MFQETEDIHGVYKSVFFVGGRCLPRLAMVVMTTPRAAVEKSVSTEIKVNKQGGKR